MISATVGAWESVPSSQREVRELSPKAHHQSIIDKTGEAGL